MSGLAWIGDGIGDCLVAAGLCAWLVMREILHRRRRDRRLR